MREVGGKTLRGVVNQQDPRAPSGTDGATPMKSTMLLILAVLAVLFGCAASSSSPQAFPGSIRQAVCERYGGMWRADGSCEIQSPGPGN